MVRGVLPTHDARLVDAYGERHEVTRVHLRRRAGEDHRIDVDVTLLTDGAFGGQKIHALLISLGRDFVIRFHGAILVEVAADRYVRRARASRTIVSTGGSMSRGGSSRVDLSAMIAVRTSGARKPIDRSADDARSNGDSNDDDRSNDDDDDDRSNDDDDDDDDDRSNDARFTHLRWRK
ncbi:MAG: hypothetical protein KF894_19995 [Labilithrix sp.]|nr:hypothetical protein [Labilithrix sp.]